MSVDPTKSRDNSSGTEPGSIMAALRKSGYLLEQEVATELESLGFHVQTNVAYQDPDEGKSREIDVTAAKRFAFNEDRKIAAFFDIVVECKNSSQPLVFIGRPKNSADNFVIPKGYQFPVSQYEASYPIGAGSSRLKIKKPFDYLSLKEHHYAFRDEAKTVQFCRLERKGSEWNANHGGLYDAIFYPIAKMVTDRTKRAPANDRNSEWRYFWFVIPMLVTSASIYYVDSSAENPMPVERDHVHFRRELKSAAIEGVFGLDFVQKSGLTKFVEECFGPITKRIIHLVENEPDTILNGKIEWDGPPPI